MILKKGNRLRHNNCLDMDIILASDPLFLDKDGYYEVRVWYYNRNYNQIIDLDSERIRIKEADLDKWELIEGGLS